MKNQFWKQPAVQLSCNWPIYACVYMCMCVCMYIYIYVSLSKFINKICKWFSFIVIFLIWNEVRHFSCQWWLDFRNSATLLWSHFEIENYFIKRPLSSPFCFIFYCLCFSPWPEWPSFTLITFCCLINYPTFLLDKILVYLKLLII